MNIFLRQISRKPIFTILTVLLLGFSVALSCIGYSAWTSAKIQHDEISSGYTTIAVPIEPDLTKLSPDEIGIALQNHMLADFAARKAKELSAIDRRCLLSAHIEGKKSLSSSRIDPSEYNIAFDSECYSLAVFALRCENIKESIAADIIYYDATFEVEEIVCLSDAYDSLPKPDVIHIYSDLCDKSGALPFEVGKTYLVFGQYQDYRIVKSADGYRQVTTENRYIIPFPELDHSFSDDKPSSLKVGKLNGRSYHFITDEKLHWVSEYVGTAADYLSGDSASIWSEYIIPLCRLNHESAAVILTDRIESMYAFNTKAASLFSGRFFTDDEYSEGSDVCVISAAYAELNDIKLGDKIQLDYYDSSFITHSNGANSNSALSKDPGPYRQRYYMTPEDAIGVRKEYTVVGIYTGARFAFGAYQFNADTIIVPKASVPEAQNYEEPGNSLLNTFILKNGFAEQFEKNLEKQGLGGQFLYLDQGYSSMQESLNALETNALRLTIVGGGVFLLASALFIFLNFRRMKPIIRGVRLLGISPKAVFGEIISVLIPSAILAVALGAGLSVVLFDTVTKNILSSTLTLHPQAPIIASVSTFVVIAISIIICTVIAVQRKLMKAN